MADERIRDERQRRELEAYAAACRQAGPGPAPTLPRSLGRLSGRDFTGLNLSRIHLRGRSFRGSDFSNSDLSGANIVRCFGQHARFERATLNFVNAENSKLDRACFDGARIENSDFSRTSLRFSSFREAQLSGVEFRRAALFRADFTHSKLFGVDFCDADADEADFFGSHLRLSQLHLARSLASVSNAAFVSGRGFHLMAIRGSDGVMFYHRDDTYTREELQSSLRAHYKQNRIRVVLRAADTAERIVKLLWSM